MKRALRWIKRIVLGALALAILTVGIALVVVHTDWGRNKIRAAIVDELQADFPGSTIDTLAGSPFGTLTLTGITLMASDGKPLVTIAEVRLEAALRPLLGKRIRLEVLALAGVRVFVRENLVAPPPSEPTSWSIEMPKITVHDAVLTIEGKTRTEVIEQLVIRAAVNIPASQPVAASADVSGRWRGKPLTTHVLASVGETARFPLVAVQFGGASLVATNIDIGTTMVAGTLRLSIPGQLITELTGDPPPGDIDLTVHAATNGAVTLAGSAGTAHLKAHLITDFAALHTRGIVVADIPELSSVSQGQVTGAGTIVLALDANIDRAVGIATIEGSGEHLTETARATLDGTAMVAFAATLDGAEIIAAVGGTAQQLAGVRSTRAVLVAHGPVWPDTALAIRGTVDATGYRDRDTRVATARVGFAGTVNRERQASGEIFDNSKLTLELAADDIRSGTTRIPSAMLTADATITGGADQQTIVIALGPHRVRMADGSMFAGSGGRVTVTDDAIDVTDVHTGTGRSRVVASGRLGRLDESLTAKITARDVSLAIADPTIGGTVDADLDVARRGGRWSGTATVRAHQVALPDRPIVDATVTVKLAGRKVNLDGRVGSPQLGTTTIAATVTGPHEITNPLAWQRLPRTAVDNLNITIAKLDAAALGGTGIVNGTVAFGPTGASGTVHVRGVVTSAGPIDAEVTLGNGDGGTITVNAIAQAEGLPPSTADVRLALPERPFSPLAWQQLGLGALEGATLKSGVVRVDPALLARFGYREPYSAEVDATATIGKAGKNSTLTVDVRGLTGGKLTSPVDIDLDAGTTDQGTTLLVRARSGGVTVNIDGSTPLTIARALKPNALTAPIAATITIPEVAAREVLGLLGETDVLAGTVKGTITVAGTIADPTVHAQLAARALALKASSLTNKPPPTLETLEVDARLSREQADVVITGREGTDRLLEIKASGDPRDPRSIIASIRAANFDLAPIAAFGSGAIRAARGTLSGALKIKGLDPKTGDIRGQLALRDVRFPLSPELGTLRRGTLEIDIVGQKVTAKFDGRLGAGGGSASGTITSELVGGMPMNAHLEMKLKKVSPIGALQPQLDADIIGNWANMGSHWEGSVAVRNGKVIVPPESGSDLLMTGAPSDMIFIDRQRVAKTGRRPPEQPWLITRVAIGHTDVDVQDQDARVRLVARGELIVEIGDGVGIRGQISTTTGRVELLGRRYRIEQGVINFDGLPDPRLDIRVVHDFKNMTLTVDVRGRASNPDLRLSGDPGTYTEGQLLSFLLGAEPGEAGTTQETGSAVVSGGLAALSGRVGQKINKYLPIKVDRIDYEAGSATTSRAVRFGKRLGEKSYLLWRQRLSARPDENTGEVVFEYQLRPWALFEATIGERNKGADILLRKRW